MKVHHIHLDFFFKFVCLAHNMCESFQNNGKKYICVQVVNQDMKYKFIDLESIYSDCTNLWIDVL